MSSDPTAEPPSAAEPAESPRFDMAIGPVVFRGLVGCLVGLAIVAASLVAFVTTCGVLGMGLLGATRWAGQNILAVASVAGLIAALAVGVGLRRAWRGKPPDRPAAPERPSRRIGR